MLEAEVKVLVEGLCEEDLEGGGYIADPVNGVVVVENGEHLGIDEAVEARGWREHARDGVLEDLEKELVWETGEVWAKGRHRR